MNTTVQNFIALLERNGNLSAAAAIREEYEYADHLDSLESVFNYRGE